MSFRDPVQVSPPGTNSDHVTFAINSKIMLIAFIVILFFVVLMVSLHLYYRLYLLRSRSFNLRRFNRSRRASAAFIFFADPSSTSVDTTSGLDSSVIKSLPIFTFSAATAPNAIECAVCLSEFEDSETGRVLPNCKHTFHVDCIDMWFHSHSSCPLCRSLVEPIAAGVKSDPGDHVPVSISDSLAGDDQSSRPELCDTDCLGGAGSSGNYAPEDSRRKPAAIVVRAGPELKQAPYTLGPALIVVPRRNLGELENDLSRSQSFRSPMSRVRSFTRILSRERRSASSSSIGLPPVASAPANSTSVTVTELDMELGGGGDSLTYA